MRPRLPLIACSIVLPSFACADEPEHAEVIAKTYTVIEARPIDVLLVIDDSPSMRSFTSNGDTAINLATIAQIIEEAYPRLDARVAITTTSVPGPTCSGPLARGGELLTDSCVARASESFVGPGELEPASLDLRDACTDACALDSLALRPSPVDAYESELAVRPWIEADNNSYGGNLPSGVSLDQALVCAGMRGFGGCEYESPLAAASRALGHMRTPGDPASGFLREGVPLLIVFIGDEDDCSHPDASAELFDPEGDGVFWTSPAGPSSGICHRASTACDADGCTVVDRNLDGEPTDAFASAALTSLVSFEAELDTLRAEREVVVGLVGGVTYTGELWWGTTPGPGDPRAEEFGWGPGCTAAGDRVAQPPGRLYQIIDPYNAYSICALDWTSVFAPLVGWTGGTIDLQAAPLGIADADPDYPGLQPDCEVRVRTAVDELLPVPQCLRDEQGWVIDPATHDYAVPDGAERCWVWLSDPGALTADPYDDLWVEAVELGIPAQLRFARRQEPESYLPRGSVYESVCAPL